MTAPKATPQQATVPIAVMKSRVQRSGVVALAATPPRTSSGQAMARPTRENTDATRKSAWKPPRPTISSPSEGAIACVPSVETPKMPSAAARRPGGANSTASVDAALKPAAKASPCTARSTKSPGPTRSTRRYAAEASAMTPRPPRRKTRRPKRSSSWPMTSTEARPERPVTPITRPMVRSLPPSARKWSGRRKNEAKVRKKQKFATVTRAKAAARRASSDAAGSGLGRGSAAMPGAAACRAEGGIIHARHGHGTTARDPTPTQAAPRAVEGAAARAGEGAQAAAAAEGVLARDRREPGSEAPELLPPVLPEELPCRERTPEPGRLARYHARARIADDGRAQERELVEDALDLRAGEERRGGSLRRGHVAGPVLALAERLLGLPGDTRPDVVANHRAQRADHRRRRPAARGERIRLL